MDLASTDLNVALLQKNDFQNKNLENIKNDKALKQACDNFESFFMQQMLDISLKSTNVAGEGTGSDIIKGLYTENLSKASAGTMGISDLLFQFLADQKKGK